MSDLGFLYFLSTTRWSRRGKKEEKEEAGFVLAEVQVKKRTDETREVFNFTNGGHYLRVCVCVFTPQPHTHKPLNYVLDDFLAPWSRPEVLKSIREGESERAGDMIERESV